MIPIQNVYYLFLYAWQRFPQGEQIKVEEDWGPDLPNLLAKVLATGIQNQLRRGLNRGYVAIVEELAFPRGKFLLADTIKCNSLVAGRAVCQFDELTTDTPPNRILRATLRRLYSSPDIEAAQASKLQRLDARMEGVARLPLSPTLFRSLQLTRSQAQYGLLMDVCRLVMDLSLPEGQGKEHRFSDVLNDEVQMSMVFESFVRNFYRHEQKTYVAGGEDIHWPAVCATESDQSYLPRMRTDVTLKSDDRVIVIDTKFYKDTFAKDRFSGAQKIHSENLYQLQTYLTYGGFESDQPPREGVLLYPCLDGRKVRLDFQLPNHRLRVCTVDLNQRWPDVQQELLSLIDL